MTILCSAPSVHYNFIPRWLLLNSSTRMYCRAFRDGMRLKRRNRHQWMTCFSKGSSLQDSMPSLKPSRLLTTEELKTYPNTVPEEIFSTIRLADSDAFYVLELSTNREFSSSLLDKNSAILICLIDVDGDSLLQRVPAIYLGQPTLGIKAEQSMPFQSCSVDVVTFKGSKVQRIKEVWIGLESGSWRLDGLSLNVIHGPVDPSKDINGTPELKFNGLQYTFDKINVPLGEDGASVAEARPVAVMDLSGVSLSDLQGQLSTESNASNVKELKEDGLRQYADLKQSLLLYDAAIVITGFSVFTLASNDNAAYSFLVGGIGGFFYLLLVQRSVDGLPVISSPSEASSTQPPVIGFSGVRRPWLILSLVLVAGAAALKYGAGGDSFELTPTELFVGTAGFLANKVAVLLAAFKPMQSDVKGEDGSGGQHLTQMLLHPFLNI